MSHRHQQSVVVTLSQASLGRATLRHLQSKSHSKNKIYFFIKESSYIISLTICIRYYTDSTYILYLVFSLFIEMIQCLIANWNNKANLSDV